MKPGKIVATLSLLGSLAALIPSVVAADNYDIGSAARNAATRSDHEAVAKYYEDVAREMQAKVQEKKELLEQYENKSYLYGRQAQDLKAHADALVNKYEKLAKAHLQEAVVHRQMALQLQERGLSQSGLQQLSVR